MPLYRAPAGDVQPAPPSGGVACQTALGALRSARREVICSAAVWRMLATSSSGVGRTRRRPLAVDAQPTGGSRATERPIRAAVLMNGSKPSPRPNADQERRLL